MKLSFITPLAFAALATQLHAEGNLELKDARDKASYAIGLSMGSELQQQSAAINPDSLAAGLKDALNGAKPRLTDQECTEALTAWQKDQMGKLAAQRKEAGEKNRKEGEKFLADNKAKEGIKSLASGVQYKVLKEGTGACPKATSTVKTHCRGTLLDGTEFFSTYKDKQPATFAVNEVIKGWSEVLPLMKVGSKWQVFIPAELAYGEKGAGRKIGPNAALIFEIELVGIES
jgi:FKBP-type peptidyl-prolyl cis-trans isomerase FklB